MKKIVTIFVLLFLCKYAISQGYPPIGSPYGNTMSRLQALNAFYLPTKNDTATALSGSLDILGMMIYNKSDRNLYYRDTTNAGAKKWTLVGGSGNGILVFNTISDMTSYSGAINSSVVSLVIDTLQGGVFTYTNSGTQDSGVVFSRTSGGFFNRLYNRASGVWASWWGAKGDGVTNDTRALQLSSNYASLNDVWLHLATNANYYVTDEIYSSSLRNYWVDGHNSLVTQAANKRVVNYTGGYLYHQDVSSIQVVEKELDPNAGAPSKTLKIVVTGLDSRAQWGKIIKITSTDSIPFTKRSDVATVGSLARLGQFLIIADRVNDTLWTNNVPEWVEKYVNNIKIHGLTDKTAKIKNIRFQSVAEGDTALFNISMTRFRDCNRFELSDVESLFSWGPVVEGYSLFQAHVKGLVVSNSRSESGLRVGYGFRDFACQGSLFEGIQAYNVRHAYATNISFLSSSQLDSISNYGNNIGNIISNSLGYGCNNAAFDTHDGALNMKFIGCRADYGFSGGASEGNGFAVRGIGHQYIGCSSKGCRRGMTIFAQYADSSASDILVQDCKFESYQYPLIANSVYLASNIRIQNSEFKTDNQFVHFLTNAQITFTGCTFINTNGTFSRQITPTDSCLLVYNNCVFQSPTTPTTHRFLYFQGQGNVVTVNNSRFETSETIDRLIFADNHTGFIKFSNLTVDHSISELIDSSGVGNLNYYAYNFIYDIAGSVPTTSANLVQTISTNARLRNNSLLDPIIRAKISLNDTATLAPIDSGKIIGQVLEIRNDASAFSLFIHTSNIVRIVNDTMLVLRPRGTVRFIWDGTRWSQQKEFYIPTIGQATDANYLVGAGIEKVYLPSITANRAITLRDPTLYKGQPVKFINQNPPGSAFRWAISPAILRTSTNTSFGTLVNGSTLTVESDGVKWIVTEFNADSITYNKLVLNNPTQGNSAIKYIMGWDTTANNNEVKKLLIGSGLSINGDSLVATGGGGGGGTFSSLTVGNGLTPQGTYTSSANVQADTSIISTRFWRNKGLDSIAAVAAATYVPLTRTVNGKALSSNITLGLASADFANQGSATTVLIGNAAGPPSFGAVNLGTMVTGTTAVGNGGTGQTSYTNGQLLIGNTTGNTLTKATLTGSSTILITNGAGSITLNADTSRLATQYYVGTLPTLPTLIDNLGSLGDSILTLPNDSTIGAKRLVAGSNITLTPTDTTIVIAASGGGGSMAIASPITSATAGSVLYAGTNGYLQQSNSNFFYDSTNARLGLGTTSPAAKIHSLSTTEQLRLGYDASNYVQLTVNNTGSLTLDATGTNPTINFSDRAVGLYGSNATTTNSTWAVHGTTTLASVTTSTFLFGGASSVLVGVSSRPSSGATPSANQSVSFFQTGQVSVTEASSGTHAVVSPAVFNSWTMTNAGGATGIASTVYIEGPQTGVTPATFNGSLYIASGNSYTAGKWMFDNTYTAGGTTGNQTINKPTGSVNIAAAGTAVTVTNSFVTANSLVKAWCMTNDATAYVKNVTVTGGSFTVNLGAAATAETKIGFEVIN